MEVVLIFLLGLGSSIIGVLVFKKEKRLFENSVRTNATVVTYYDYINYDTAASHPMTMYTMAVEYLLPDGTRIHAREQAGRSYKKYPVGKILDIVYSCEQPEMFVIYGDSSRKIAMVFTVVFGFAMMGIAVLVALKG